MGERSIMWWGDWWRSGCCHRPVRARIVGRAAIAPGDDAGVVLFTLLVNAPTIRPLRVALAWMP